MTCVVGLVANGKVSMGSDRLCTTGDLKSYLPHPKVFFKENKDFKVMVAVAGDIRVSNLVQHELILPDRGDGTLMSWLLKDWISSYRYVLDIHGALRSDDGQDDVEADMLIAAEGKLFLIGRDFGLFEVSSYYAIGTGNQVAMGAMYISHNAYEPVHAIKKAIEAAKFHGENVGGDIDVLSL